MSCRICVVLDGEPHEPWCDIGELERENVALRALLADVLRAYSGYIDETETTGAAARARAFLDRSQATQPGDPPRRDDAEDKA